MKMPKTIRVISDRPLCCQRHLAFSAKGYVFYTRNSTFVSPTFVFRSLCGAYLQSCQIYKILASLKPNVELFLSLAVLQFYSFTVSLPV